MYNIKIILLLQMAAHKTCIVNRKLAKALKTNRPLRQWARMKIGNKVLYLFHHQNVDSLCLLQNNDSFLLASSGHFLADQVQRQAPSLETHQAEASLRRSQAYLRYTISGRCRCVYNDMFYQFISLLVIVAVLN